MVDGGGGNTILKQLKAAGFDWKNIIPLQKMPVSLQRSLV